MKKYFNLYFKKFYICILFLFCNLKIDNIFCSNSKNNNFFANFKNYIDTDKEIIKIKESKKFKIAFNVSSAIGIGTFGYFFYKSYKQNPNVFNKSNFFKLAALSTITGSMYVGNKYFFNKNIQINGEENSKKVESQGQELIDQIIKKKEEQQKKQQKQYSYQQQQQQEQLIQPINENENNKFEFIKNEEERKEAEGIYKVINEQIKLLNEDLNENEAKRLVFYLLKEIFDNLEKLKKNLTPNPSFKEKEKEKEKNEFSIYNFIKNIKIFFEEYSYGENFLQNDLNDNDFIKNIKNNLLSSFTIYSLIDILRIDVTKNDFVNDIENIKLIFKNGIEDVKELNRYYEENYLNKNGKINQLVQLKNNNQQQQQNKNQQQGSVKLLNKQNKVFQIIKQEEPKKKLIKLEKNDPIKNRNERFTEFNFNTEKTSINIVSLKEFYNIDEIKYYLNNISELNNKDQIKIDYLICYDKTKIIIDLIEKLKYNDLEKYLGGLKNIKQYNDPSYNQKISLSFEDITLFIKYYYENKFEECVKILESYDLDALEEQQDRYQNLKIKDGYFIEENQYEFQQKQIKPVEYPGANFNQNKDNNQQQQKQVNVQFNQQNKQNQQQQSFQTLNQYEQGQYQQQNFQNIQEQQVGPYKELTEEQVGLVKDILYFYKERSKDELNKSFDVQYKIQKEQLIKNLENIKYFELINFLKKFEYGILRNQKNQKYIFGQSCFFEAFVFGIITIEINKTQNFENGLLNGLKLFTESNLYKSIKFKIYNKAFSITNFISCLLNFYNKNDFQNLYNKILESFRFTKSVYKLNDNFYFDFKEFINNKFNNEISIQIFCQKSTINFDTFKTQFHIEDKKQIDQILFSSINDENLLNYELQKLNLKKQKFFENAQSFINQNEAAHFILRYTNNSTNFYNHNIINCQSGENKIVTTMKNLMKEKFFLNQSIYNNNYIIAFYDIPINEESIKLILNESLEDELCESAGFP